MEFSSIMWNLELYVSVPLFLLYLAHGGCSEGNMNYL